MMADENNRLKKKSSMSAPARPSGAPPSRSAAASLWKIAWRSPTARPSGRAPGVTDADYPKY